MRLCSNHKATLLLDKQIIYRHKKEARVSTTEDAWLGLFQVLSAVRSR
jgi:hypothetical protein